MLDESIGIVRPTILAAAVEVRLMADAVDAARTACDELSAIAAARDLPLLTATAAFASGCVLLAEGDAAAALAELRRAYVSFHALEMPYDAARSRVQLADACRGAR